MADKDRPSEAPQLELPSMGSLFKRKKKSSPPSGEEPAAARSAQADEEPAPQPESAQPEPLQPESAQSEPAQPEPLQPDETGTAEASDVTEETEVIEETRVIEVTAAAPRLAETPVEPQPSPAPSQKRTIRSPQRTAAASPSAVVEPGPSATRTVEEESGLDDIYDDAPNAASASAPAPSDDGWRFWRLPDLDGRIAAAITGLVIGLLAVGLTAAGLSGCEAVRGTSSCGGSGLGVLLLIMIALVALGSLLLTAWQVPDPTSTSFLAVGLLAVVSLLFLIEVILSMAMIVVIPLITVATFSLSHWVTTHFTDDE